MARDFAALLKDVRCWDAEVDANWFGKHILPNCIVQKRPELIAFCEWIESKQISSYLEIGIWTGALLSTLQALFQFKKLAACDAGAAAYRGFPILIPPETHFLPCESHRIEYRAWRQQLGMMELVLIDGDHSYEGVKSDFEINSRYPHRFLVFHDIDNPEPQAQGVGQLWRELEGYKLEIIRHEPQLISRMGIGIWSATEQP